MITRIFGSHSSPGRLFFDDVRQTEKDKGLYDSLERSGKGQGKYKSLQTDLSTQVRIDRPSHTAASNVLYTSEFGIKDLTFIGSIAGWLECTQIDAQPNSPTYSLLLLMAGLWLLERIGGISQLVKDNATAKSRNLRVMIKNTKSGLEFLV